MANPYRMPSRQRIERPKVARWGLERAKKVNAVLRGPVRRRLCGMAPSRTGGCSVRASAEPGSAASRRRRSRRDRQRAVRTMHGGGSTRACTTNGTRSWRRRSATLRAVVGPVPIVDHRARERELRQPLQRLHRVVGRDHVGAGLLEVNRQMGCNERHPRSSSKMRGSSCNIAFLSARYGIIGGHYTQSRDEKYTSNFAPCAAWPLVRPNPNGRVWEPNRGLMALQVHRATCPRGWIVQVVYELAPMIATIISAHCPGTRAREDFVRACVHGDWERGRVHDRGHARRALAPAGPPGDAPARVPGSCCS